MLVLFRPAAELNQIWSCIRPFQFVLLVQLKFYILYNIPMIKILAKVPNLFTTNLTNKMYKISVYEGISPALLATMSLSQGIKGQNNQQMINSLVKNNIVRNKILETALKKLDRKHFVKHNLTGDQTNFYENRPYRISGGQHMTDIFTHAVILEGVCERIQQLLNNKQNTEQQSWRILDIGTGHGYIAFAIAAYLQELAKVNLQTQTHKIIGVDSNQGSIQFGNKLRATLGNSRQEYMNVEFHPQSIQERLSKGEPFDIIIGGFYMPPSLHQSLVCRLKESHNLLKRSTFGIWATDSQSGQSLYKFNCVNNQHQMPSISKSQIMSTMFSMPTVKTKVSKYFVQDNQSVQSKNQSSSHVDEQQIRQKLKSLKKIQKQKQKQRLKQQLKLAVNKHSAMRNKKLSLDDMKKIPQINELLQKLNQK